MKQEILDACIAKRMKCTEGARLVSMHPKSFSRLKARYQREGMSVLVGQKPGPKRGQPVVNRTTRVREEQIIWFALDHPELGPVPLADALHEQHSITIHPTTIWRILKRYDLRYGVNYQRIKQPPQLYCLDQPGLELQFDACYPYGRARKLASFDAIDDCSRLVYGHCYERETIVNAIRFVHDLIARVPFTIQRLRVDNRYGKSFKKYCETNLGIEVIVNEPYHPQQNGKIERFHKTLKREFYLRYTSFHDSMEMINYRLGQWLEYYNYQRKHTGYGMHRMTPAQKIAATMLEASAIQYVFYPHKVTGTLQQYSF